MWSLKQYVNHLSEIVSLILKPRTWKTYDLVWCEGEKLQVYLVDVLFCVVLYCIL